MQSAVALKCKGWHAIGIPVSIVSFLALALTQPIYPFVELTRICVHLENFPRNLDFTAYNISIALLFGLYAFAVVFINAGRQGTLLNLELLKSTPLTMWRVYLRRVSELVGDWVKLTIMTGLALFTISLAFRFFSLMSRFEESRDLLPGHFAAFPPVQDLIVLFVLIAGPCAGLALLASAMPFMFARPGTAIAAGFIFGIAYFVALFSLTFSFLRMVGYTNSFLADSEADLLYYFVHAFRFLALSLPLIFCGPLVTLWSDRKRHRA